MRRNLMGTGSYHLHNIDKLIAMVGVFWFTLLIGATSGFFMRQGLYSLLSHFIIPCLVFFEDGESYDRICDS